MDLHDFSSKIAEANLSHRHCADDQSAALGTCIAAGIGQHRDKGDQHRHRCKGALIPSQNRTGNHTRNHQCHQPEYAVFCQCQHTGFHIAGLLGLFLTGKDWFCFFRLHQAGNSKTQLLRLGSQPVGCCHRLHLSQAVADCLIVLLSYQAVHVFLCQSWCCSLKTVQSQSHVFHCYFLLTVFF